MNSLNSILKNKSFTSPLLKGVNAALTIEAANAALVKLFGPSIAEHATAAYMKDEILHIACLSSTAAQEIKLQEKALLSLINDGLPSNLIKKVRYIS